MKKQGNTAKADAFKDMAEELGFYFDIDLIITPDELEDILKAEESRQTYKPDREIWV